VIPAMGVKYLRRWAPPLVLIALLVGFWQIFVVARNVPSYLFPAPSAIWQAGIDEHELLLTNAVPTAKAAILGFGLAIVAGILLAVALHRSRVVKHALYPILVTTQTVPLITLAPILVVMLGYGILPELIIVCLICFFPIIVNTVDGLASVDVDLLNLMRTMGAGRWRIFRDVEWPSALPYIFSGARVAVTYSVVGAIFGEWAGSYEGLGYVMTQKEGQFDTPALFAAMALLSMLGIGLFVIVIAAERLFIPWHHGERGPQPTRRRFT
jgi:putative hydroxymethylpyrimidine transport system permease protein